MELLWIPISLLAGLMQAVRTAAQKDLNAKLSTMMTTYVRSIYGFPFMILFLAVVMQTTGEGWPEFNTRFLLFSAGASIAQAAGTFLLIYVFTLRNFAVGTMLTKTDVMMAAIIGSLLFSEVISPIGWIAIGLTVIGVLAIAISNSKLPAIEGSRGGIAWGDVFFSKSTLVGLSSGFGFCLSYLFLREASLSLPQGSFTYRAGWTVIAVTGLQVLLIGIWLVIKEPQSFSALKSTRRQNWFIGLTSAIGSICWFTAMTLQNASYVKAVGQVEAIFTILISTLFFREKISLTELFGMAVIVTGVLMFLL